jgi:AcrR family transcriptional regulator
MAKRPLTRRRILRAALRLIDRDGLDALSMRRLGAALGVEAMALYRHVGSKGALLEGVAELLLEELELPDAGSASWQDTWTALAHSYRRLARGHPGAFRLLALSPLGIAARFERAWAPVTILRDAGFDEQQAERAFRTLLSYADGYLLREQAERDADLSADEAEAAFDFGIRAILAGLERELGAAESVRPLRRSG